MGNGEESFMLNAQCPKWRGGYPSTDTWGWSFPPLLINSLIANCKLTLKIVVIATHDRKKRG
ncbi:MAG: hypothetical protein V7K98_09225 [Nostoc sp.]